MKHFINRFIIQHLKIRLAILFSIFRYLSNNNEKEKQFHHNNELIHIHYIECIELFFLLAIMQFNQSKHEVFYTYT